MKRAELGSIGTLVRSIHAMNIRRSRPAKPKVTRPCERCSRPVTSGLLCTACRVAKCRGLAVDRSCHVCGIAHPRLLRAHSFVDAAVVLCANHDALAGRQRITLGEFEAQASQHGDWFATARSA